MTDDDTELARDIGYAMAQSPFKVKGQRIETLRLAAEGVVKQLRRAGWQFWLRPPEALHGTSGDGHGADPCSSNNGAPPRSRTVGS